MIRDKPSNFIDMALYCDYSSELADLLVMANLTLQSRKGIKVTLNLKPGDVAIHRDDVGSPNASFDWNFVKNLTANVEIPQVLNKYPSDRLIRQERC